MISFLLASMVFQNSAPVPALDQAPVASRQESHQWWTSLSKEEQEVFRDRMNRWQTLSTQDKKEMKERMHLFERNKRRADVHHNRIHRALRQAVQEKEITADVATVLFEGPPADALFVLGHLHKERFLVQASANDFWTRHEISLKHEALLRAMRPQEFFQSLAHLGILGHSFSRRGARF